MFLGMGPKKQGFLLRTLHFELDGFESCNLHCWLVILVILVSVVWISCSGNPKKIGDDPLIL